MDINNKRITSIEFSDNEMACKIEDAILVLDYLKENKKIVLGGDILNKYREYNYDNWYYNIDLNYDIRFNLETSHKKAKEYLANYIQRNGDDFYVLFVID